MPRRPPILLHTSLRHGRHTQAGIDEDLSEPRVLGRAGLRLQTVPAAFLESGALVTRDAQQRVPGAGQRPTPFIGEIACGEPRIEIGGQQVVCAAHQRDLGENAIDGQCVRVAPVPVPREAVGPLRDGFEPSRRLRSPGRQAENQAAQQIEPRIPRRDLRGQETAGRDEQRHALPQPEPACTVTLDEIADQPAVARRPGTTSSASIQSKTARSSRQTRSCFDRSLSNPMLDVVLGDRLWSPHRAASP